MIAGLLISCIYSYYVIYAESIGGIGEKLGTCLLTGVYGGWLIDEFLTGKSMSILGASIPPIAVDRSAPNRVMRGAALLFGLLSYSFSIFLLVTK